MNELRQQLSRCIIENQSEDGSIDISDQGAMLDELLDAVIAALPKHQGEDDPHKAGYKQAILQVQSILQSAKGNK